LARKDYEDQITVQEQYKITDTGGTTIPGFGQVVFTRVDTPSQVGDSFLAADANQISDLVEYISIGTVTAQEIVVDTYADNAIIPIEVGQLVTGGPITIKYNGGLALPLYSDIALTEAVEELEIGLYQVVKRGTPLSSFYLTPKGGAIKIGNLVMYTATTAAGTEQTRQTTNGEGVIKYVAANRPWAIRIDGTRYPTTGFFQSTVDGPLRLNAKFESQVILYQTTGSSVQQIRASIVFKDGTSLYGSTNTAFGLSLYHSYPGKGVVNSIHYGLFSLKIDGVFIVGTQTAYGVNGRICSLGFPFETGIEVWYSAGNGDPQINYETL